MKIDVKHIAELSRIKLSEKELEKLTPQMETIINSVPILKEVDTDGIQPMKRHIPFSELREDIPGTCLSQEDALRNAKYKEMGCVKVYGKVFGGVEES